MAEGRVYRDVDRAALHRVMAEALGDQKETYFDNLIEKSAEILLVSPAPGGVPEGFCRLVRDQETRARRRACMDLLYLPEGAGRLELGRVLIDTLREKVAGRGLEGIWGYFTEPFGRDFLDSTGGKRLREIRLFRRERLDELPRALPPKGYRLRSVSLPDDLDLAAGIYNDTFSGMWNFRPHGPEDIAEWFKGSDTVPEDCLIVETLEGGGGGIAVLAIEPARVESSDPTAYVPDIGVTPSHRRKGLGRVLISAAAERAQKRGLTAIELIADNEDPVAKKFYKGLGFDEMGKIIVYEW